MVSNLLMLLMSFKKKHLEELETDDGQEKPGEGDDQVDEDSNNDQDEEWQEELDNNRVIELADNLRETK